MGLPFLLLTPANSVAAKCLVAPADSVTADQIFRTRTTAGGSCWAVVTAVAGYFAGRGRTIASSRAQRRRNSARWTVVTSKAAVLSSGVGAVAPSGAVCLRCRAGTTIAS